MRTTLQGQFTALSLTNNKFTTYNREGSISFHPYYQVRYYLPTTHFCRPHRYGPFAACWLLSRSLRTERSPSPSLAPLTRMRRRILLRDSRRLRLALWPRAASSCCGSRPQDDPKGFDQLAISIPGLKLHIDVPLDRATLTR